MKKKAKYYTRALVMTSVDETSSIEPGLIYPSSAGDQLIPMSRLTTKVGGVEMPFAEAATTPITQAGKDGKTVDGLPPFRLEVLVDGAPFYLGGRALTVKLELKFGEGNYAARAAKPLMGNSFAELAADADARMSEALDDDANDAVVASSADARRYAKM